MNLLDIDREEIFGLSVDERQRVIDSAVELYIRQCERGSCIIEKDFLYFLNLSLVETKKNIKKYEDTDDFEVCYFLNEVVKKIEERYV